MVNIPDDAKKKIIQKKVISGIKDLPPYPDVISKAKRLIDTDSSGIGEISDLILKDPALAGRVLKLANSAYYNVKGQVGSIKYATQILGLKTLIEIIETAAIAKLFNEELKPYKLSPKKLWQHSIFVAICAKKICSFQCPDFEADAFTAGLLHDCGKILLAPSLNNYKDIFNKIIDNNIHSFNAEIKITGISHTQAGYAMVKTWKLPSHIQDAIKDHHNTTFSPNQKFSAIIAMANLMAVSSLDDESAYPNLFDSINRVAQNINLDINQIIEISSQAYEYTEEICNNTL